LDDLNVKTLIKRYAIQFKKIIEIHLGCVCELVFRGIWRGWF